MKIKYYLIIGNALDEPLAYIPFQSRITHRKFERAMDRAKALVMHSKRSVCVVACNNEGILDTWELCPYTMTITQYSQETVPL